MEKQNFSLRNYSLSKGKFERDLELQRRVKEDRIRNINPSNLKVKKSIMLSSPIFSVKYSYFRPNILCTCEESGVLSIIDTQAEKIRVNNQRVNSMNEDFNNTLAYHEIEPVVKYQAHNNSIFDFDWCFSDNKVLTASGDMSCQMINLENGSNILNELMLIGHTKSIKTVKQAFYDDNIIASCGRDGMIYIWDIRTNNKRFCNKNCEMFKIPHIHPVGGFKSMNKVNGLIKKKSTHGNLINEDCNTFTGLNFFSRELIVSIETNEDDIKFWDMRKMLGDELEYFMTIPEKPHQKLTRKQITKLEEKENCVANCNQYSHIYMRYVELQESNKMSSKHNTSKNLLFNNLPSNLHNKTVKVGDMLKLSSSVKDVPNKRLDSYSFTSVNNIIKSGNSVLLSSGYKESNNTNNTNFANISNTSNISNTYNNANTYNISNISNTSNNLHNLVSPNKIKYGINFVNSHSIEDINKEVLDQTDSSSEKLTFTERRVLPNSSSNQNSNMVPFFNRDFEEEQELKNTIKEIAVRKNVKGLTSIYINRENRKILVNSMSHSQYIYDCLYWDKLPPIELKGHKSSFCVKSVLSPDADYVLSGSFDANIYIWNVAEKNKTLNQESIKLTGFHSLEVGAVDWGRNYNNFIASACDNGLVLIWDDK